MIDMYITLAIIATGLFIFALWVKPTNETQHK